MSRSSHAKESFVFTDRLPHLIHDAFFTDHRLVLGRIDVHESASAVRCAYNAAWQEGVAHSAHFDRTRPDRRALLTSCGRMSSSRVQSALRDTASMHGLFHFPLADVLVPCTSIDGTLTLHRIRVHELVSACISRLDRGRAASKSPRNLRRCLHPLIYDTMDPASAIIGIVSFGFSVFAKVNEIRKSIKGAPEQVQALQDTCDTVEMLLRKLQSLETHLKPQLEDGLASLKRLCERSQRCLEEVEKVADKVVAKTSGRKAGSAVKVQLRKWVLNKDDLEDTSKKLNEVREALRLMMEFIQFHYVEVVVLHIRNEHQLCAAPPVQYQTYATTCISPRSSYHRQTGTLRCKDDCTCQCHALSLCPIVPQSAVPYFGQLFISQRILDWMKFDPLGRCNVETCRGTYLKPAKVAYTLPWSLFHGSFCASSNQRIHFSINAYRTVPYSSPIIQAIWGADVCRVRDLFAKQQASIGDVDIDGGSILSHACERWQNDPTEDQLKIVRFLVEAGADALLFAGTETTYSPHDLLAIGLFAHLLGEHEPGRSFTATIQNNSAAIAVFRSIFNMDALDALQDLLSRRYWHSDEDALRLLTSLEATEYTVARSSVFDAINYTPLEYAIQFSPSSVESLLAEGADATAGPTLAYAALNGRGDLIALLIDKGADVNMKYEGRTALHWACHYCDYYYFFELLRCAESKIDWDARTPEGQNALDLFDEGVSRGHASGLTSEQINEFRSTLVSHMDPLRLRVVDDKPLDIPGTFPVDTESS